MAEAIQTRESGELAEAIIRTTRQPFLVLDGDMRVVAVNPAFLKTFQVSPTETQGARLYDLGNGQWNIPELRQILAEVVSDLTPVENYRVEHEFETIGRRVMLLNASHIVEPDRGERVLLAISDVTETEGLRWELEAQKEFAEMVVDSLRDPLLVLGWDLTVKSANEPFYETFQVDRTETEGTLIYELGNGQWNIPELRQLLEDVLPDNQVFDDYEVEHDFETIGHRVMLLNGRRLNHHQLILLSIEDVTEKRRGEAHQRVVMGELQHRVKNILMNVRAVARQTRQGARDLDDYLETFEGRLGALARAQDLLVRSQTDEVELADLLELELGASGARDGETFTASGPPVEMPSRMAHAMAMTVHELTTNASKHGALAGESGTIEITWRVGRREGVRELAFTWRERGVAIDRSPERRGFGMEVIEHTVPYSLRGTSEVTFHGDGLECQITIPLAER